MIHELHYKKALKKRHYVILNEDIDSGEYRRLFYDAFMKYKDTNDYEVEEYQAEGLIVKLPSDYILPENVPILQMDKSKTNTLIREVFKKCREQKDC